MLFLLIAVILFSDPLRPLQKPQIRVYYITLDNRVQELKFSRGKGWSLGATLCATAPCCVWLYARVRVNGGDLKERRVGYEAGNNLIAITETYWRFDGTGWGTGTF